MYDDASGISFQLAMYRWEDDMRQARATKMRRLNGEAADFVVAQYNDLALRFNTLVEAAQKTGEALGTAQGKINSLLAGVAAKDAEIDRLKERLFETEQSGAVTSYHFERLIKSEEDYMARALAAEAELKALRSQKA